MDYGKVLRQSWNNVWRYRALWVFGIILALTMCSWSATLIFDGDNQGEPRFGIQVTPWDDETFLEALGRSAREEVDEFRAEIDRTDRQIERFFARELNAEVKSDVLAIVIILATVVITVRILARIASYVSDAALMRMVDGTADTGVQHSARQGLRMGWSRAAWRLFVIDLLVTVPALAAAAALLLLVATPLALWATGSIAAGVFGTIVTVGLFVAFIALVIVGSATLSMLKQFFKRKSALEGRGVLDSMRQGYALVKRCFREIAPMWLLTVCVNIAWSVLMMPVVVTLVGLALVLGGASAVLLGVLAAQVFDSAGPWLVAVAVGIPIFVVVLLVPLAFLGGLRVVFLSSTWTLTYRELRHSESVQPSKMPGLDPSPSVAASTA